MMEVELPPLTPRPDDRSPGAERREADRWAAVERGARIAWHEGRGRFRVVPAELLDISEKAAALTLGGLLEEDHHVWLGLSTLRWEWVSATVRSSTRADRSSHYVLEFCEPCPRGLIDHATLGAPAAVLRPTFEMFPDDGWD